MIFRGFILSLLGFCVLAGTWPRASFAKNHSPLPEVVMLDDEGEEPPPPPPKKNTKAKPAPAPAPAAAAEPEDADETAAAPAVDHDRDRIPVMEEPPAKAAAPAPSTPAAPTPVRQTSSVTTEEVSGAPAMAAPSGETLVKPQAGAELFEPAARDPLAPPPVAGDDIVIDPAKLPKVLPEKAGAPATKPAVKSKPRAAKAKPGSTAKKPAAKAPARKAASTAAKKKAANVFEKGPAASLDENPDAPYRDPALDQDDDAEEYSDREPADDGEGESDVRTFRDTIRSVVDFNSQWEVNFVKNGRYRIRGQPNEIFDYQQSGQYLEVQVLESERRILSIQPIKVRFRQIR